MHERSMIPAQKKQFLKMIIVLEAGIPFCSSVSKCSKTPMLPLERQSFALKELRWS